MMNRLGKTFVQPSKE